MLDGGPRETWLAHEETFRGWIELAMQMEIASQRAAAVEDGGADLELVPQGVRATVQEAWAEVEEEPLEPGRRLRAAIQAWFDGLGAADRERLGMNPQPEYQRRVHYHATRRVTSDGRQRFGLVVQLVEVQTLEVAGGPREVPSGATVVLDVTGRVRFVIPTRAADSRRDALDEAARLALTSAMGWETADPEANPFAVDYRALHEERA